MNIVEFLLNKQRDEGQELVEDLIQIRTVFSYKLQGKQASKAEKMIKELKEHDSGKESET